MRRLARAGFLRKWILPLFGYYPWECFACRKVRLLRVRGKRVLRRLWDDDLYIAAEEPELPVNAAEPPVSAAEPPSYEIDLPNEERALEEHAHSSQWTE